MKNESLAILIADDSPSVRASLAVALARMGHRPLLAETGLAAIQAYQRNKPDLALIDVNMPDADGYEVARAIRESDPGEWVPIVFLSGVGDEESLERGIEAGGDDYLAKPVSQVMLAAKLRAMQRVGALRERLIVLSSELLAATRQLDNLSVEDTLTKLANRRGLEHQLAQEIARSRRNRTPLSLAIVEIDFFRRYTDYFGLAQADDCLRHVGGALKAATRRAADFVARIEHDRYALVLPDTPAAGALVFGGMLARAVDELALNHPKSECAQFVTISGGIASCVADEATHPETMLMRADEALYTAKQQGRHRFFSFDTNATTVHGVVVQTLHLPRSLRGDDSAGTPPATGRP